MGGVRVVRPVSANARNAALIASGLALYALSMIVIPSALTGDLHLARRKRLRPGERLRHVPGTWLDVAVP
jgi:hypothetical protein